MYFKVHLLAGAMQQLPWLIFMSNRPVPLCPSLSNHPSVAVLLSMPASITAVPDLVGCHMTIHQSLSSFRNPCLFFESSHLGHPPVHHTCCAYASKATAWWNPAEIASGVLSPQFPHISCTEQVECWKWCIKTQGSCRTKKISLSTFVSHYFPAFEDRFPSLQPLGSVAPQTDLFSCK